MVLASSWYDPVVGVDIHIVLVPTPAGPVPTPMPMPFVGMVFDPVGAVVGAGLSMALSGSPGLAMVNSMLATNCGTEVTNLMTCPHIPAPGPFAAPPGNDAELYFGSLNVSMAGTLGVRLGDMALSCSDPVRLPTSLVVAIPKGMPVLNMPAMVPDLIAICMAAFFKMLGAGFRRFRAFQETSEGWAAFSAWARRHAGDMLPEGAASRVNRMICAVTGHPVDVATGRMFTEAMDFELPGPLPLRFERVYDTSLSWRETSLGWGWSHSLDEAVWYGRGRVFYKSADGRQIEFHTIDLPDRAIRPGQSLSEPYQEFTLRCVEPYRFEVETHAGVVHEFARVPGDRGEKMRLMKRRTRDGHTNEFHYDRLGWLEYAVDSGGRIVRFEHDDRGRLVAVKLPLSREHGWYPFRRFEYDAQGDLTAVLDSHNKAWRFEYTSHLMVQETDRAGLSFYFQYDGHSAYSKCVRTWGDGGIYDHEITYDPGNRKTIVRDSVGAVTVYELDEVNAVVAITDAHGGRASYERCRNTGKVLRETNALGEAVEKAYDARGNLVRVAGADGAATEIEYHERLNVPTAARDALGRLWRWVYDEWGHLLARQNPAQETTMYTWSDAGLLESVQSPGERVTRLAYDERKNVVEVTLPNGAEVQYEHDGQGRVVRTRDALGGLTRVERCSEGWTRVVHLPMGVEQQLAYDDEGNLLEARDPNRHARFGYGHYHRLVWREEGGTRLRFEYDTEDRLTAVVNEAGERYTFTLNALGQVQSETGFDGFTRKYVRDAEGRVVKTELPSGRKSQLRYDGSGRVAEVAHSDGSKTEFQYDLAGQLLSARNESADVRFERDALGRIVSESQDGGQTWVRSGYEAGRRRHVESDFGALQRIEHDALGEVSRLANGASAPGTQGFLRNALGLEVERQLPGGVHVGWTRDVAGRPLERHTWRASRFAGGPEGGMNDALDARAYQWRGADQIAAIINPSQGPTFYDHDDRGRWCASAGPDKAARWTARWTRWATCTAAATATTGATAPADGCWRPTASATSTTKTATKCGASYPTGARGRTPGTARAC
jgi:YD repeat-containing protein